MTSTADDPLIAGKAALSQGDLAAACSLLTAAVAREENAEALHELARAVEWAGGYRRAIELYERAFVAYRALGDVRTAALIAGRELSFLYAAVCGNDAVAAGWMARARSLADEAGECVETGWVRLADALMTDDPAVKAEHVAVATELGRQFGSADLTFCALGYEGTQLVLQGRIAEGMRRVDEAATAAASGEVRDYLAVGEIYCKMLLCCELTLDVRRAQQWMEIAEKFGQRSHAPWVSAICRTHYGAILTAAGRWSDAESELSQSITDYEAGYQALRSSALVRLADLRVKQGRYAEASALLVGFEFDTYAVRPLARLHLARGEFDIARTVLRRALDATGEHPLQAPELALLVEVEVAAGRLEHARSVCARLTTLAQCADLPRLNALARYSTGITAAAAGEDGALADLEAALPVFAASGLPLEAARTRLAIARLLAGTEPEVAIAEARSALDVFESLAAAPDADATAGLLRGLGAGGRRAPRVSGPLTRREQEVLAGIAEGMTNEQLAARMYISKRTVEHHVSSVLAKLGVSTRAEAAARAIRLS